ncbi:MAG: threonine/serine exporter family protein [Anaerolineae bacterium]
MNDIALTILADGFWSAIASMGFAILFNVPRRSLIYCMIGGAVGHAVRTALMLYWGWSIELASLMGAVLVGFWAQWCAHHLKLPSMVIAISAVIPMVPGVFAYQTMIGILQMTDVNTTETMPVLVDVSINAIKTGVILASLAVGIVTPSLLFQRIKPVV